MTPACLSLQLSRGFGNKSEPFMACSLESCSKWCEQEFGRSVGSIGFGCQNVGGSDTLAFCECADGGRTDPGLTRAVLCREPVGCSECDHGYCSTSPIENARLNNMCAVCEPGFELLPAGICVNTSASGAESSYTCPMNNGPCINGICVDGDADMGIPYSCKCRQGFEGPTCSSGSQSHLLIYFKQDSMS